MRVRTGRLPPTQVHAALRLSNLLILVNAAGWDRLEPFLDNSFEFMEQIVRLNLLGPVKLTRELVPSMVERGSGKIVKH